MEVNHEQYISRDFSVIFVPRCSLTASLLRSAQRDAAPDYVFQCCEDEGNRSSRGALARCQAGFGSEDSPLSPDGTKK